MWGDWCLSLFLVKRQITKLGAIKIEHTELDNWDWLIKPKINLWVVPEHVLFLQKADPTGSRTWTPSALVMVVLQMKIYMIQR